MPREGFGIASSYSWSARPGRPRGSAAQGRRVSRLGRSDARIANLPQTVPVPSPALEHGPGGPTQRHGLSGCGCARFQHRGPVPRPVGREGRVRSGPARWRRPERQGDARSAPWRQPLRHDAWRSVPGSAQGRVTALQRFQTHPADVMKEARCPCPVRNGSHVRCHGGSKVTDLSCMREQGSADHPPGQGAVQCSRAQIPEPGHPDRRGQGRGTGRVFCTDCDVCDRPPSEVGSAARVSTSSDRRGCPSTSRKSG